MGEYMSQQPFRIGIVGGGITGLYCALAIHHHCTKAGVSLKIDVYEQAAAYKDIGAGISLRPDAAQLVYNVGLKDKLDAISGRGDQMLYRRFDDGGEIVSIPMSREGAVKPAVCARSELLEVLKDGIESRGAATLHTGMACRGVDDLGDGVRVHFADSTTAEADLLIGSDGIHSQVRRQFVSDNATFSGFIAYRGVIPMNSLPPWPLQSYSAAWLAKHRHFLTFSISRNESLNIVAFVTKEESQVVHTKESWTSTCPRSEVEKDFAGFCEIVQDIIKLMPEEVSRWRINDHERLDRWHYFGGKVLLLGDAAHAMTPHLGAGGSVGVADGWALGRALSEYLSGSNPALTTLGDVAELYQAARLPSAHRTQAASRANGDNVEMQTPELIDKDYDECCAILGEGIRRRLNMSHSDDTDTLYEEASEAMANGGN
ncbi:hypothetical protein PRZ48_015148 [Zasmidium cellare]|uniref:FAD-binding domain-containing protein n=1 Tax=Zasmidium cellare TaxID=395010 RepID=A0ABR0DXR9_ZASCE|nr:hypothetical protein PRZ48_015148 [Zasmidium cellare]